MEKKETKNKTERMKCSSEIKPRDNVATVVALADGGKLRMHKLSELLEGLRVFRGNKKIAA